MNEQQKELEEEVKREVEKLKRDAKRIEESMKRAMKSGDTAKADKLKKELDEMSSIEQTMKAELQEVKRAARGEAQ